MGGEDVLLLPRLCQSVPHYGVPPRRSVPLYGRMGVWEYDNMGLWNYEIMTIEAWDYESMEL